MSEGKNSYFEFSKPEKLSPITLKRKEMGWIYSIYVVGFVSL
jgi:hypothetical protein